MTLSMRSTQSDRETKGGLCEIFVVSGQERFVELRHLEHFVAVAEEMHFGRAARRLHMAQSPLSQSIRRLEAELGVPLFERDRRRVALTAMGQAMLPGAREALAAARRAGQSAKLAASGQVGQVRIGFVGSAAFSLIPDLVRAVREAAPALRLHLHELPSAEQLAALRDGLLDLAIVRAQASSAGLQVEVLRQEALVAALPDTHRLSGHARVALRELADDPWILFPRARGPAFYDQILGLCARAGFAPNVEQEASYMPTIVSLVAAGLGVSLVPGSLQRLSMQGAVLRPLKGAAARVVLAAAWHAEPVPPALQVVLDTARSA